MSMSPTVPVDDTAMDSATSPPAAARGGICGIDPSTKRAGSMSAWATMRAAEANTMAHVMASRRFTRSDIAKSPLIRFYAIAVAATAVVLAAQPQAPVSAPFDLEEATVAQLQDRMTTGRDTSRSLVDKYLARIQAVDRTGPELRSVLDLNPSGSSSGSAAAIAASLATIAVGTETDGSIVSPSQVNSLVGIKPTLGLVSRTGIVPIAHSQDTAGPMARTVTDAALLLAAMAGADARDAATSAAPTAVPDYTRSLDPKGLDGARIGIARTKLFGYHAATDAVINRAIDVLRRAGAVIVDPADIPHLGEYDDAELTVLLYEFKADVNRYLAEFAPGAPVKTLQDVIEFNERNKEREMPYFGQELFLKAQDKGSLSDQAYSDALDKRRKLARDDGLQAILDREKLDALVAPTGNPPWPIDLINGDHFLGGSSTPAAVAGFPHVTVPAGYVSGLPVGVSFIGAPWSEGTLVRLAYAYEQATTLRRPPRFLPTMTVSTSG